MAFSESSALTVSNAMNILQRLVKNILSYGVGVRLINAWLRYRYLRRQQKLFEKLAGIRIRSIRLTISQQDEYTSSFIGGSYSSAFITSAADIARLISLTPRWADQGWQVGYQSTLASSLSIPVNQNIKSIRGREGRDIYRILTVDSSTNAVYFELREY